MAPGDAGDSVGLDEAVSAESRDIVAGIGFRHAARPEAIVALVRLALATAGLPEARLRLVSTAADRVEILPFRQAAAILGVDVLGLSPEALQSVDAHVPTRSARIEAARGIGSLAEAAALSGAGTDSFLILARISDASITCALAQMPAKP